MENLFKSKRKSDLESGDLTCLTCIKSLEKDPNRGWNVLHYACQLRNVSSIYSILSSKNPVSYLASTDKASRRPCDLLPVPELNFFNLYSWGVGSDYQLGYPKEKQLQAKKIELFPIVFPSESVISISTYKYHSLCITEKHELWAFGCGRRGVLGVNSELTAISPVLLEIKQVIMVAVGEMHSICVFNI